MNHSQYNLDIKVSVTALSTMQMSTSKMMLSFEAEGAINFQKDGSWFCSFGIVRIIKVDRHYTPHVCCAMHCWIFLALYRNVWSLVLSIVPILASFLKWSCHLISFFTTFGFIKAYEVVMSQAVSTFSYWFCYCCVSHLLVQEKKRSSETSEGIPRNLGWSLARDLDALAELPVLLFEFGLPPVVQLNTKNTKMLKY
jgi:hypothetical protein